MKRFFSIENFKNSNRVVPQRVLDAIAQFKSSRRS